MPQDNRSSEQRRQYLEKFKDPRWQKMRLKVFERDEWTCMICYSTESTLNVHHRYYLPGKEPWEYPIETLITLCEDCHKGETENRPEEEQTLLRALREKFFASDVNQFAIAFKFMPMLHLPEVVASVYEWALKTPEIQKELIKRYFEHLAQKGKSAAKDR